MYGRISFSFQVDQLVSSQDAGEVCAIDILATGASSENVLAALADDLPVFNARLRDVIEDEDLVTGCRSTNSMV